MRLRSASATVAGFEFVHAIHDLLNPETLCVFYGTTQIVKFEAHNLAAFFSLFATLTVVQQIFKLC
jgi:hypothetical protein